ncbi:MAG: serine/threonine-protein kinase [Polyangiaceae bacterium]
MSSSNNGSVTAPPGAFTPGIVIGGKFTILRLIEAGGVGAIYEAKDTLVCRRVALKLLHAQYAKHPEVIRRFLREAQVTASIEHANVAVIYEMGSRRDGTFFIAQELLKGDNLRKHLAGGWLDIDEALQVVLPIADLLVAAHRKGIVHRDVKPENIVLAQTASAEVVPKLVDFGVAKLRSSDGNAVGSFTTTGSLLGTMAYMSPEQARGELRVDGRADVWALGVVLFELLCGRCPYEGPTDQAVLAQVLTGTAPRLHEISPSMPMALSDIVKTALERDAERRSSMQTFREKLLAFRDSRGRPPPAILAEPAPERGAHAQVEDASFDAADIELDLDLSDFDIAAEEDTIADQPIRSLPPAAVHPELDWKRESALRRPQAEQSAALVDEAIRINALDEAIRRANEALARGPIDDAVRGRLRLAQAIASYWLGDYPRSESYARHAMASLRPGTSGWCSALGHVAIAGGQQGRVDHLANLEAMLLPLSANGSAYLVAMCRLAQQFLRAGHPDRAREIVSMAEGIAATAVSEPFARAWLYVAQSELAVHEGDPMKYMDRVKRAAEDFVTAGDIRNASLQQCNIGNAYLSLGDYKQAERTLCESLETADPMKLSFAAPTRVNLGLALARLGELEDALEVEKRAFEQCVRQENHRFAAVAQIYLALIYGMGESLEEARQMARAAVEATENAPAIRAYALAVMAQALLGQKRRSESAEAAQMAMELLSKLDGAEECEALIRLIHARAVAETTSPRQAAELIVDARARLVARANRISDPRWRESFLRNIPENAQTLALAKLWGDRGSGTRD